MGPEVSIVIRSKNDIRYIGQTMDMIAKQKFQDFEIVNVDSCSTDGTWQVIKQKNRKRSYQIRPDDYIPGKILNDAVRKCRGKIIVFNNSDCVPVDDCWLENLIRPLENNDVVAGCYGRQLPREDAWPLVVKDNERAYGDGEVASKWEHFFSLASSAIPKQLLEHWPFDERLSYSEDIDWSYLMKQRGYVVEYARDAVVEHSHNYSTHEVYKRFYGEGVAEGHIYHRSFWARSFVMLFLKPFSAEVLRDIAYLIKRRCFREIPHSFVYRSVQKFGVYKGNHDYAVKESLLKHG